MSAPGQQESGVDGRATGYRIRPMEAADVSGVVTIEREAFSTPWSEDTFRSLFRRPPWVLLVMEGADGGVAGYAVLGCVMEQGELANIAIRKEHRGQGLGGLLLDRVLDEASVRGVRQIFLEVRLSNTGAASLYRSRGFQEVGIRKDYYEAPREHARVLVRRLTGAPSQANPGTTDQGGASSGVADSQSVGSSGMLSPDGRLREP
jgi:[ribosomal protein S18]-alanine N-acetyltransferase